MRQDPWWAMLKTIVSDADLNKFNWEMTDRDQGNFEFKMVVFL